MLRKYLWITWKCLLPKVRQQERLHPINRQALLLLQSQPIVEPARDDNSADDLPFKSII